MKPLNLFCLPGWAMSARAFDPLKALLPDCTMQDFDDKTDPRSLPEDAVLLGWSFGAQRALALAARRPLRGVILIGVSPRFVASADWQAALSQETVEGFRDGFAAAPEATLKRFLALQAVGEAQRGPVLRQLGECMLDAATPGLNASLDALCSMDLRDETHLVDCPALLLHGENDALMPAQAARWLTLELPHADLYVFEHCGHAPHISRAAETAALIRDFAGRL